MVGISQVTKQLLDGYGSDPATVSRRWEARAVDVVLRHGSPADADVLLPVFLADPELRGALLPVFAQYGDTTTAERLLEVGVEAGIQRLTAWVRDNRALFEDA